MERELKKFKGRDVFCNALQTNVLITGFSIDEISSHASKTRKSTIAALNIIESIEQCEFVKCALPHSKREKEKFVIMYLFKVNIEDLGVAKVTIGATFVNGFIQYCITQKEE